MNSSLDRITEMFKKMQGDGFDTEKLLKWGFYFIDSDTTVLQKFLKNLNLRTTKWKF